MYIEQVHGRTRVLQGEFQTAPQQVLGPGLLFQTQGNNLTASYLRQEFVTYGITEVLRVRSGSKTRHLVTLGQHSGQGLGILHLLHSEDVNPVGGQASQCVLNRVEFFLLIGGRSVDLRVPVSITTGKIGM